MKGAMNRDKMSTADYITNVFKDVDHFAGRYTPAGTFDKKYVTALKKEFRDLLNRNSMLEYDLKAQKNEDRFEKLANTGQIYNYWDADHFSTGFNLTPSEKESVVRWIRNENFLSMHEFFEKLGEPYMSRYELWKKHNRMVYFQKRCQDMEKIQNDLGYVNKQLEENINEKLLEFEALKTSKTAVERELEYKKKELDQYKLELAKSKESYRLLLNDTNLLKSKCEKLESLLNAEKEKKVLDQKICNDLQALGLNFLDGEPENLRAAMIRKMKNRELDGMATLSKNLSPKNLKLFRNWHDNEKSGLSFLNGIPDLKVMSNLRGYCANRQFTGAESLLDVIPAANKKGYLAWKKSLSENAPVKATYGIGNSHPHKQHKTVKATSPVPEAGDPSNFFQKKKLQITMGKTSA